MQNYDMIGYRDTANSDWRVHIVRYSGSEADVELDSLLMCSYTRLIPVMTTQYSNASDSYWFWRDGYNVVYSSEMVENPYYHTYQDSTTYIDYAYVAEVARSAVALLLTVDASLTSVPDQKSGLPLAFVLEQNYPNPFNPKTSIAFTVGGVRGQGPGVSLVHLAVYDILGREVSTLVNGSVSAGRHAVTFDASSLSSGVYIYRLVAGNQAAVRRMVVVK